MLLKNCFPATFQPTHSYLVVTQSSEPSQRSATQGAGHHQSAKVAGTWTTWTLCVPRLHWQLSTNSLFSHFFQTDRSVGPPASSSDWRRGSGAWKRISPRHCPPCDQGPMATLATSATLRPYGHCHSGVTNIANLTIFCTFWTFWTFGLFEAFWNFSNQNNGARRLREEKKSSFFQGHGANI